MKKIKNITEEEKYNKKIQKNNTNSLSVIDVFEPQEVLNCSDIGRIFQFDRKNKQMTQESVAGLANVGKRFISELENGKGTMQIDKIFKLLNKNGFKITISKRKW